MAHKTHVELNDDQYDYLLDLCSRQGKSITKVICDLIEEKKQTPAANSPVKSQIKRHSLKKLHEHRELIAKSFDEFHYGE